MSDKHKPSPWEEGTEKKDGEQRDNDAPSPLNYFHHPGRFERLDTVDRPRHAPRALVIIPCRSYEERKTKPRNRLPGFHRFRDSSVWPQRNARHARDSFTAVSFLSFLPYTRLPP